MKRKVIIFIISIWAFLNVNAHNPNSDSLIVYIDNIFVGKKCCVDFDRISSILLENYYCKYLLECTQTEFLVNDPFSIMNPKAIKQFFIEKNDILSTDGILHIRTKKAKDGYLLLNKHITGKIMECCNNFNEVSVLYVYNGKIVSTKDDVKQLLKLREKDIEILSVTQEEKAKVITVNFIVK